MIRRYPIVYDLAKRLFLDLRFTLCAILFLILSIGSSIAQMSPENGFYNPTNTGYDFGPVYICQNYMDSIAAQNLGTKDITLKKILIINQKPPGTPQFFFDTGGQSLMVNELFNPNNRRFFHIIFQPTMIGWDTATIICYWDSAGVKTLISTNLLIGYGTLEREVVSLPDSIPPGKALDTISVPVSLVQSLPYEARAGGMIFAMTFPSTMFNLVATNLYPTLSLVNPPQITNDGIGNETVLFTLQSSTPITYISPILTLRFVIIAPNDTTGTITISHPVFWGNNPQDSLCYVIATGDTAKLHVMQSDELAYNLHNIEVVSEAEREVTIVNNDLVLNDTKIRVVSIRGVDVISWEGMLGKGNTKKFTVLDTGSYFILIDVGGKEYIFKRVL